MNAKLPPFKIGERNSKIAFTLDRDITTLRNIYGFIHYDSGVRGGLKPSIKINP